MVSTVSAQDEPVDVGRGGTLVGLPGSGQLTDFVIKIKNTTGEAVSDVTIVMDNDTVPISGVDILDAPLLIENGDVVDDNGNGREDPGETDSLDSSPGRVCRTMLRHGLTIAPDSSIDVGITFSKPFAPGTNIHIYLSKKVKDRHYNIASADGSFGISTIYNRAPTDNTVKTFIDSLEEVIKRIFLISPIPLEGIDIAAPFAGSVVQMISPFQYDITFVPAVKPFDAVDIGFRFAELPNENTPPILMEILEAEPYNCQLLMYDVTASPCNPFGTYDLSFQVQYNPPTGVWQDYTFVNNTGQPVSDLEVVFAGTGGALRTVVIEQTQGCPLPAVPSNGHVTNTMHLSWLGACIPPESSVKVRIYAVGGPVYPLSGTWSASGQAVGSLNLPTDAYRERSGGRPMPSMQVFVGGQPAGTNTPTGLGDETISLSGLPANGAQDVPLSLTWGTVPVCQNAFPNAFDAPLCPPNGYFAIESVEQLNFVSPIYAPESDIAQINFAYAFPGASIPLPYLNVLYQPPQGGAPAWIIQNVYLEPGPDTLRFSMWFDLDPTDTYPSSVFDDAPFTLIFSGSFFSSPPPILGPFIKSKVKSANVSVGRDHVTPTPPPLPGQSAGTVKPLPPATWVPTDDVLTDERTDMPNIDLNGPKFAAGKSGVPADYAGDVKGCAPAGVTNCYSWLRKHHPAIDDSLDVHPDLNNNSSDSAALRNMMYEMSRMMKRDSGDGTSMENIIRAKLEFADKYKLPIRVKYQNIYLSDTINSPDRRYGHRATPENRAPAGAPWSTVSLDWIHAEKEKGEDVELSIAWVYYDPIMDTFSIAGHVVVLTDIDSVDGVWYIKYRDDAWQGEAGGTNTSRTNARVDKSPISRLRGFIRLENKEGTDEKGRFWACIIRGAYSQSYDPTITFKTLAIGSTQVTPVICPSTPTGSIVVTPVGGVPPYTVTWSNGLSGASIGNLTGGNYGFTITDAWGNTVTGTVVVPSLDVVPPTITISINNPVVALTDCCMPLTAGMFGAVTADNCGPVSVQIFPPIVDCSNLGTNVVTLVAIDDSGNATFATANVTVIDVMPPIAVPTNIVVTLDPSGQVTVNPAQVGAASFDNCTITTYSLDQSTFTCANVGANPVTLTVIDAFGNASSAAAMIEVQDNIPPVVATQNITVMLDALGMAMIQPGDVLLSATDACGILSVNLSQDLFSCFAPTENDVVIDVIVTDVHGNVTTAPATVTVIDPLPPVLTCPANITLQYCGPVDYDIPQAFDNCVVQSVGQISGLGSGAVFPLGVTVETWRATDLSGNHGTCSFTVTVAEDWDIIATIDLIRCNGGNDGAIELDILGGQTPFSYLWSNGQTGNPAGNLTAGAYSVTATDANGCTSVRSYTVEEPDPLVLTVVSVVDETNSQSNGSITLAVAGGAGPFLYNGQLFTDTITLGGLAAGDYLLVVNDANNCTGTVSVVVKNISGTVETGLIEQFLVYPNPANDQFRIAIRLHRAVQHQLRLFNEQGKLIQTWPTKLDALIDQPVISGELAPGVYWIELKLENGSVTRKVVISR